MSAIEEKVRRSIVANFEEIKICNRMATEEKPATVTFEDPHSHLKGEVAEIGISSEAQADISFLCLADMISSFRELTVRILIPYVAFAIIT